MRSRDKNNFNFFLTANNFFLFLELACISLIWASRPLHIRSICAWWSCSCLNSSAKRIASAIAVLLLSSELRYSFSISSRSVWIACRIVSMNCLRGNAYNEYYGQYRTCNSPSSFLFVALKLQHCTLSSLAWSRASVASTSACLRALSIWEEVEANSSFSASKRAARFSAFRYCSLRSSRSRCSSSIWKIEKHLLLLLL